MLNRRSAFGDQAERLWSTAGGRHQ